MNDLPLSFKVTLSANGRSLIEASAGTGKTYTITNLAIRALLEPSVTAQPLTIDALLLVTFTRIAALELQERLRQRLSAVYAALQTEVAPSDHNDQALLIFCQRYSGAAKAQALARLRAASADLDRANITTIHGFCQRIGQELALETRARLDADFSENNELLEQYIDDFWRRELATAPLDLAEILIASPLLQKSALHKLADLAQHNTNLQLQPKDVSSPTSTLAQLQKIQNKLAATWNEHADSAWRLLKQAIANRELSGKTYKLESAVASWQILAAALRGEYSLSSQAVISVVEKFSQTTLEKNTNKNKTTPRHSLFALFDQVVELVTQLQSAPYYYAHLFLQNLPANNRQVRQPYQAMLQTAYQALHQQSPLAQALAARLRRRFPLALIDEFQDTDPLQYAIFDYIYCPTASEPSHLLMIGDPKQSIYRFRGADVFTYVRAREAANKKYELLCNYRSDQPVLSAINKWLETPGLFALAGENSKQLDYPAVRAAQPNWLLTLSEQQKPCSFALPDERDPAEHAADYVAWLLNESHTILLDKEKLPIKIAPHHIAILVRTNQQAIDVQRQLQQRGIAAALHSHMSVFCTSEARELLMVLAAVLNPNNTRLLRTALATRLLGQNADQFLSLNEQNATWESWQKTFADLRNLWERQGLAMFIAALWNKLFKTATLLAQVGGERLVTNIKHLLELLQTVASQENIGAEACLLWLEQRIATSEQDSDDRNEHRQLRLESDAACVQILTVFKSKGLEFPIVVLPYIGERPHKVSPPYNYHDHEQKSVVDLREEGKTFDEAEHAAEDMRLLYVALTRAKHHLWLLLRAYSEKGSGALTLVRMPALYRALAKAFNYDLSTFKFTAEQLATLVQTIVAQHPDLYSLSTVKAASTQVAAMSASNLAVTANARLSARTFPAECLANQHWGVYSYSGLVQRINTTKIQATRMGSDESITTTDKHDTSPLPFSLFPPGVSAGICLHKILEQLDFTQNVANQTAILETAIRSFGLATNANSIKNLTAIAVQGLTPVLSAPIHFKQERLCLAEISLANRLNELKFYLPVKTNDSDWAKRLADIFCSCEQRAVADYAELAAKLSRNTLDGFLNGIIDLAFVNNNQRWAIIDYKYKMLGPHPGDYTPAQLASDMSEQHYILQYHLYALALRRYLKLRLGNSFDWDRDFTGVAYLYLRAVGSGDENQQLGIFSDWPSAKRLTAIAQVLLGSQL